MSRESLGFRNVCHYKPGKADWAAAGLPFEGHLTEHLHAGAVMRTGVPTCRLEDPVAEARRRADADGWTMCIVTDPSGIVLGRLRGDALSTDPGTRVDEVMEPGPTTIRPDTRLEQIVERMQRAKVGTVLVTDVDGRLMGVLFRTDAEGALQGRSHTAAGHASGGRSP